MSRRSCPSATPEGGPRSDPFRRSAPCPCPCPCPQVTQFVELSEHVRPRTPRAPARAPAPARRSPSSSSCPSAARPASSACCSPPAARLPQPLVRHGGGDGARGTPDKDRTETGRAMDGPAAPPAGCSADAPRPPSRGTRISARLDVPWFPDPRPPEAGSSPAATKPRPPACSEDAEGCEDAEGPPERSEARRRPQKASPSVTWNAPGKSKKPKLTFVGTAPGLRSSAPKTCMPGRRTARSTRRAPRTVK